MKTIIGLTGVNAPDKHVIEEHKITFVDPEFN